MEQQQQQAVKNYMMAAAPKQNGFRLLSNNRFDRRSLEAQSAEEREAEKKGLEFHGFNLFRSDRIPLDRSIPDTRNPRLS